MHTFRMFNFITALQESVLLQLLVRLLGFQYRVVSLEIYFIF